MLAQHQIISVETFDAMLAANEFADRNVEYINGEILDVVSQALASKLAGKFLIAIGNYVYQHDLGHVTGADGGYKVANERYIPDVGFISKERMPELEESAYLSLAPDLAVEVVSPTDTERLLMMKVGNYLASGTTVWVVYPDEKTVAVYAPNQVVQVYGEDGTLKGGIPALAELSIPLKKIFK